MKAFVQGLFSLLLLTPPAFAEVRIGLAAPLSGPDAVFGAELRNGVEQAVADINAAGGVLGQKLIIVAGDDRGELKQALAVANRFVAEKICLVVGHFQSSLTLAASEIYADHAVLDITPSATNPQITERGLDLMFRTCGRDDQQSARRRRISRRRGRKRGSPSSTTTPPMGKSVPTICAKNWLELGIRDVLYDGVEQRREGSIPSMVAKIKAAGADIRLLGRNGG